MQAYQTVEEMTNGGFEKLRQFLRKQRQRWIAGEPVDLEGYERELHSQMQAMERELVAAELSNYDIDAERIMVDGVECRQVGETSERYMTAAGEVQIKRHMYRPAGRDSRHVSALELRAGVIEGFYTPLAARQSAYVVAQMPANSGAALFGELGNMAPSVGSLNRLPKKLSERWEARRVEWEHQIREVEPVPSEAVTMAISLDGVMAPMRPEVTDVPSPPIETPKQPTGPKGYQEVGCGTVSLYNAEGERLQTIRYARAPEAGKATLGQQLQTEARSIFAIRPRLRLVKLADGAKTNWRYLSELDVGIPDDQLEIYEILDYYHACDHLKTALDTVWGEYSPKGKAEFERLKILLKEDDDGVTIVINHLSYRLRTASVKSHQKILSRELTYFRNQRQRMRYSDYVRLNLPIASGVIEASCKTLVTQRLKLSGMFWSDSGAQAILTLRSLIQSDRWERGWELLRKSYIVPVSILA